jgi:hypothetical protein
LVSFPLCSHCLGTVISSPPQFWKVIRLIPKITASTVCFGINIQNESEITQAICRKKTLPIELVNKIDKQAKRYCLPQNCYESNMTFCLVYEVVQTSLINKIECDAVTNQILWNAANLIQGLLFIKNGERFSPKDDRVLGNSNNGSNHFLGFTSFGVDNFSLLTIE